VDIFFIETPKLIYFDMRKRKIETILLFCITHPKDFAESPSTCPEP
jgi:hypothetical protein